MLTIWTSKERINQLTKELSVEVYGLVLKLEQIDNKEINFLDIKIRAENRKLITSVYRKPTYEPILIPNWSKDPIQYKKAAFRFIFRRAILYNTKDEDARKEAEYINRMGIEHGYGRPFMKTILESVKRSLLKNANANTETQKEIEDRNETRSFAPIPSSLRN